MSAEESEEVEELGGEVVGEESWWLTGLCRCRVALPLTVVCVERRACGSRADSIRDCDQRDRVAGDAARRSSRIDRERASSTSLRVVAVVGKFST